MTPALGILVTLALIAIGLALGRASYRPEKDAPPLPWVTMEEVEAKLCERIMGHEASKHFATPIGEHYVVELVERRVREEIYEMLGTGNPESTLVPREELLPLVAAHERKSLAEGGELRARIVEMLSEELRADAERLWGNTAAPLSPTPKPKPQKDRRDSYKKVRARGKK